MMELTNEQKEKVNDAVHKFEVLLCAIINLTDKMPDINTKLENGKLIISFNTEALEIHGLGCLVQVTTQQDDNIAEALIFVPDIYIHYEGDPAKDSDDAPRTSLRKVIPTP